MLMIVNEWVLEGQIEDVVAGYGFVLSKPGRGSSVIHKFLGPEYYS